MPTASSSPRGSSTDVRDARSAGVFALLGPWSLATAFLLLALAPQWFARDTVFVLMFQFFCVEFLLGFVGLTAGGAWVRSPPYGAYRWAVVLGIAGVVAAGIGWLVHAQLAVGPALVFFLPLALRVGEWAANLGAPRAHGGVMTSAAVISVVGPVVIGLVCLAFYQRGPNDPPGVSSLPPPQWAVALALAAYYVGYGLWARGLARGARWTGARDFAQQSDD